jgi:lipoprotein NlpI
VSTNFFVAATFTYLAMYYLYDNEVEEAIRIFSLVLEFIRNGMDYYRNQSFKNWIQGAFFLIFFFHGLSLIDDTKNYIRVIKTLVLAACARELEQFYILPREKIPKNISISDLQHKMNIILKDLLTGSEYYPIDLSTIDFLVQKSETLRKYCSKQF